MKRLMDKLEKIDYTTIDVDIVLDGRDNKEFDSNWMRVYKTVEQLKKDNNRHDSNSAIREDAFMTVYNLSGYGELAEYISDDFGLISDSKMLGFSDEWLDKLIVCYENCTVPYGKL